MTYDIKIWNQAGASLHANKQNPPIYIAETLTYPHLHCYDFAFNQSFLRVTRSSTIGLLLEFRLFITLSVNRLLGGYQFEGGPGLYQDHLPHHTSPHLSLDQLLHINMDSNEDPMLSGEGFISHYSAAGYEFLSGPPENYANAMSHASSVLSEPPPDMDWDYEPDEFNTDWFDPQSNNIPILYEIEEGPPVNSVFGSPFDELPEISDSDPNSEDDPDYEDFLVDEDEHTATSRAAKSGPLEKFYKLKIDSTVTEFEKLPYEVCFFIGDDFCANYCS